MMIGFSVNATAKSYVAGKPVSVQEVQTTDGRKTFLSYLFVIAHLIHF